MNSRFLLVFALIVTTLIAADKPEKVYRIVYVQEPNEWYQKQATLWNNILTHEPANENAWMNFYKATRYARFEQQSVDDQFKQKKLDSIITEMARHIPDTYTYYYLKALNAHDILTLNLDELEKTHQRWPEHAEILYELITYAEITGQKNKVLQYSQELYTSADIARGLLEYNANVLLSAEPNAIIFTNGDNDTYPAWLLQNTQSFRTDVTIINVHLAFGHRAYLDRLLSEHNISLDTQKLNSDDLNTFFHSLVVLLNKKYEQRPIYMAATLNQKYISPFKKDLYLVGLVYRYNKSRMKNLEVLRTNLENTLRLDYLLHDWYEETYPATSIVKKLNGNYIPLFMNLAEYYQADGDNEGARRWQYRAQALAKHIGSSKLLEMVKNKAIE